MAEVASVLRVQHRFKIQSAFDGVDLASAKALVNCRRGHTSKSNIGYGISEIVRSDFQTGDAVKISQETGGALPIEMTYFPSGSAMDDAIRCLIKSGANASASATATACVQDATFTAVAATGSTQVLTKTNIHLSIFPGDLLNVTDATVAANNGVYLVTVRNTNALTVVGSSALADSTTTVVTRMRYLRNGTTKEYVCRESAYLDTLLFHRWKNDLPVGLSFGIQDGQAAVQGSLSFKGTLQEAAATTPYASAVVADTIYPSFAPKNDTALIRIGTTDKLVLSASCDLTHDATVAMVANSSAALSVVPDAIRASGRIKLYLDSVTYTNLVLNGTTSSLMFVFGDAAGRRVAVRFPAVKFSSDDPSEQGASQCQELGWTAFPDATYGTVYIGTFA